MERKVVQRWYRWMQVTALALSFSLAVGADEAIDYERRELRVVTVTMDATEKAISIVLDGNPQNITLVCMAPENERPINFRDTSVSYARDLDGNLEDLGENNYPTIGTAIGKTFDGYDVGMSWTLFNLEESDAGFYYCNLRKMRKKTVATAAFHITVLQPPRSVRFIDTESAKVVGRFIEVKDGEPYRLRCEVEGGKPFVRAEIMIDGATRAGSLQTIEKVREVTAVEETGIMMHEHSVKLSCDAFVTKSNIFDPLDVNAVMRITKDEKFLKVLYAPQVVECVTESVNQQENRGFRTISAHGHRFTLVTVGKPNALVCYVQTNSELVAVYREIGPTNNRSAPLSGAHFQARVFRKPGPKLSKNLNVYEVRLQLNESLARWSANSYILEAYSPAGNVSAEIRLSERQASIKPRPVPLAATSRLLSHPSLCLSILLFHFLL